MRSLLTLIFVTHALAFQAPPQPGIIEGQVVDSVTGEPIANAHVTLMPGTLNYGSGGGATRSGRVLSLSGDFGGSLAPRTARPAETSLNTDAGGTFRAPVAPGFYYPRAERNGYVVSPNSSPAITVLAGETIKAPPLKLNKHAVITGRILDEEGEPAVYVRVQCLRWMILGQGQRTLAPQGSAITNDIGEYRLFGLAPGKYLVSAELTGGGPGFRNPTAAGRQAYATLFFPGVVDVSAAQSLEVAPGATRQGIDFRLQRIAVVNISGQVNGIEAPAAPGQPQRHAGTQVMLLPRNSALATLGGRQFHAAVNPDGSFQMQSVPPGSYILTASIFGPNQQRFSAHLNVDVGNRDLTGLTLSLQPSLTLQGRVLAEDTPSLSGLNIFFQPEGIGLPGAAQSRVDAEGRITVSNLEPERYRVHVNGMPAGYFVKSIAYGGVSSTQDLDLSSGATGEFVITLEKGTAEINGQLTRKDTKPAEGMQVAALNARGETVRATLTDVAGRFKLTELPPGEYRLVPVVNSDMNDPETLDRLAANAEKITLGKSDRENRDLQLPD